MEPLSETAQVDRELEQARDDLREALEQVNHKVEEVEARLRPQAILRRNPYALPLMAGLVGFWAGTVRHSQPLRWLVMGAVLGLALAAAPRGNDNVINPSGT
jgi:hypothetical protein